MKFKDVVIKSVKENDVVMAGNIVDILRFRFTFDYDRVFKMFHRLTNITKADFKELMYEADCYR